MRPIEKPATKEERARLGRWGERIKFFDVRFERRQIVRMREGRSKQGV